MALFRNSGVNLRVSCAAYDIYASAQPLDFLDLAKNCTFLNWKLESVPNLFMDGHSLVVQLFEYGKNRLANGEDGFIIFEDVI